MRRYKFWEADRIRLRRVSKRCTKDKLRHAWDVPDHVKVDIKEVPDGYLIDGLPYRLFKVKVRLKVFWQVECPCCGKQVRSLWRPDKQREWRCNVCWGINLKTNDIYPRSMQLSPGVLMKKGANDLFNAGYGIQSFFNMGLLEVT